MPKSGVTTQERILDTAQDLVLRYGFAGTSVDKVIEQAGITKGTFFYHFRNKADLAKRLIQRFHDQDMQVFGGFMERAEKMSPDPLQQLLIFVGLLSEMFDSLTEPFPGCLFAAYVYQSQQFDEDVLCVCSQAMLDWRRMFGDKIRAANEKHKPVKPVDPDLLGDFLVCVLEGALLHSNDAERPQTGCPATCVVWGPPPSSIPSALRTR